MAAVMASPDPIADAFEEAERRLTEWGLACRRESTKLGVPRQSSIRAMIDHVKREDAKRKGVRKRRMQKDRAHGEPVCIRTAEGTQDKSFRAESITINSKVLEVDGIVAKLPGWMQATVIRSFLYGQHDSRACQDLRIRKLTYRQRREAAVEYVAERLAMNIGSVR